MADVGLFAGAIIGSLIFFPLFARLVTWPLKRWDAPYAKIAIGIVLAYVVATLLYAWGEADELRQTMTFSEVVATRANWLLYLPGAILAGLMMVLLHKGREAKD